MKSFKFAIVALCLVAFAVLCPVESAHAVVFGSARARVARANARADIRVARAAGVREVRPAQVRGHFGARVFVDAFGNTVIVR